MPAIETRVPDLSVVTAEVSAALEEARLRGEAAWDALRGERPAAPRWRIALTAALAGAVAGAVVALVLRRIRTTDAPDALEPEELVAVVDRPAT